MLQGFRASAAVFTWQRLKPEFYLAQAGESPPTEHGSESGEKFGYQVLAIEQFPLGQELACTTQPCDEDRLQIRPSAGNP
jgi:hypothetical protein